eukprot:TRINITY_DN1496_c0_g1::TRINITY_DN1496_c0_g1_i1::g.27097::m.27097 TRINITY_DN1496_c0_g1::TRINITY_DN1496_c0_g1_i1::g.27097  ORF type:complete len:315 (+),score=67.82,sp/O59952/LIP_THELA/35.69/6e-33,Lipase_3/PF01764.20/4.2e-32,DUF2974/PF11187.3/8.5e-08,PGAP1/PF07819.8/0.00024,Thioesterase/PF00975.15/0.0025,Abhydrolase_1/PF00561.15/0.0041,Abhydrolase_6/PF12697.2/0.0042,Abhydrolase_5/PF12695.2/0.0088,zf-RanBP/PF00641.13/0.043 TRINITY_DN1496_c0_g1_i1:97-945(+)
MGLFSAILFALGMGVLAVPIQVTPAVACNRTLGSYDENMSMKMVHYSGASYCLGLDNKWDCGKHCEFNNFSLRTVLYDAGHDTFGYVGTDLNTGHVIIAFRGSQSLRNWIDNLKLSKAVPYDEVPDAMVHSGFLEAFQSVSAQMYDALASMPSPKKIITTGHSLGGALATVAAVDLMQHGYYVDTMYTFGGPRVGNDVFTDFLTHWTDSWRVINENDIVPSLPPMGFDFQHFEYEVWYRDGNYQICNASGEDPSCYNSLPAITYSIPDHLNYLGEEISSCSY